MAEGVEGGVAVSALELVLRVLGEGTVVMVLLPPVEVRVARDEAVALVEAGEEGVAVAEPPGMSLGEAAKVAEMVREGLLVKVARREGVSRDEGVPTPPPPSPAVGVTVVEVVGVPDARTLEVSEGVRVAVLVVQAVRVGVGVSVWLPRDEALPRPVGQALAEGERVPEPVSVAGGVGVGVLLLQDSVARGVAVTVPLLTLGTGVAVMEGEAEVHTESVMLAQVEGVGEPTGETVGEADAVSVP